MRSLEDQLAAYAAYHRDARNIATHFIGIPLIVVSLLALLSRPAWGAGGLPFSPACAVVIVAAIYYLRLNLRLGVMMLALLLLCLVFGAWVASLSTAAWLSIGIGGFVIGWLSTVLFLIRKSEIHNRIFRNHLFLLGYGGTVVPGESNRTVRLSAG
ncbi:DUF962 domain-containing protein [Serratia sp. CY66160]|uniref:Mpo1 family 2-hydroxy fatty acid dioxygenase n=1 Tax=Serratia sp. CY66160 TaxID=3383658 RepID=UPI003FA0FAFF